MQAVCLCLTLDSWSGPQLPRRSADSAVARWTLGWVVLFAVLAGDEATPAGGRPAPGTLAWPGRNCAELSGYSSSRDTPDSRASPAIEAPVAGERLDG
jgi:hypothetical protein